MNMNKARALVEELFDGVTDKGGKPYAEHCVRVADRLPHDAPEDAICAALLHDVIEDCPGYNAVKLLSLGFSERTVSLVQKLSRPPGLTYMDWIREIAGSGDEWLTRIKLADNADNSDPDRIAQLPPDQQGVADRYRRARKILEAGLTNINPRPAPLASDAVERDRR